MHLPCSLIAVAILTAAAAADTVQLPYQAPDSPQAQWFVQQMGVLQQQGNQPVFSQAGMLTVNGQPPQRQVSTADYDEKRKELVLAFMPINGVRLTRRFKFEDGSPVRVVDVFDNPADREAVLNLNLLTNTNFGVNDSQTLTDPKNKETVLGWAATTGERTALDIFGGKGSKIVPTVRFQPNNNMITAQMQMKVPGRSKRALVHWHGTFDNTDAAQQWAGALREAKAVADLPTDVRRALVNVAASGGGLPDGLELLRGTTTDVVELNGGDVFRGDLGVETYTLATEYGEINLPAANVAGIVTSDGRQWVVTTAGEIFAGKLGQAALPIKLAGGQTPSVSMANVTRLGYRTASGSADTGEWTLDGAMAFLASGERFKIDKPAAPFVILTRYGRLSFAPQQVAAVLMPASGAAHQIFLTDGSRLSGVLADTDLSLKPSAMSKPAAFATAAVARIQLAKLSDSIGVGATTLGLLGDDCVAGRLEKQINLVTAFDTLPIAGPEVRSITRPRAGQAEVAVTTADGSVFRGTLADATISVSLAGGTTLTLPAAALRDYDNPAPYPAASVVTKIEDAVKRLNSDDWKTREAAEAELNAGGASIIGVLQNGLADQPPEARDRMTAVLKTLRKDSPTPPSRLTPPPAVE